MPTQDYLQKLHGNSDSAAVEIGAAKAGLKQISPELGAVLMSVRLIIAVVVVLEAITLALMEQPAPAAIVVGYACYAFALAVRTVRSGAAAESLMTLSGDVLWLLLLAWIAGVSSSIFILLLLFPVLFAALGLGVLFGLLISLVAAVGSVIIVRHNLGSELSFSDMLLPLSILILGPLTAALLRPAVHRRAQTVLADQLLDRADSRQGIERVLDLLLKTLQQRYAARRITLLLRLPGSDPRLFRRDASVLVELKGVDASGLIEVYERLPDGVASERRLLRLPGGGVLSRYRGFDTGKRRWTMRGRGEVETLAERLQAESLVVVPVCRRFSRVCWLTVEAGLQRLYLREMDELVSIMDQLAPVIENAVLLEQLCDEAMLTERARIGRDLHDTAIQPYLGIKFAIEALALKASPGNALHDDIVSLREMVASELQHLHEVVSSMRSGGMYGDGALATALHRQAKRFSELFGIAVAVHCESDVPVSRWRAAAFLQIVSEALTNIRRHTRARSAEISLIFDHNQFVLRISNDHGEASQPPSQFMPASMTERTKSLGGRVLVQLQRPGFTDVIIIVPSHAEEVDHDERSR